MTAGVQNFQELKPRILVIGVGGAGGNAVNNMISSGLQGVEFVAANTDAQALSMSCADVRFQLGVNLTEGLGAGSNPEIGEGAAEEVLDEMRDLIEGAHMVFVACGMGGGTGTGAAPVVARVAQELGVLTVAVVTKPFHFEGRRRMRIAEAGIEQLRRYVDTMIVIPNQNLFRLANEQTTFADSFQLADQVLNSGVACVTDLIMKEGLINLDFADVKTVITEMGAAVMGTGMAHGEGRGAKAAEEAISNPLIDEISLKGAKGLLISISGGPDMTLYEVDEVASRIRQEVDPDANIIVGAIFDDHLQGHLRVSLVASGLNHAHPKSMHEEADRLRMEADAAAERAGLEAGRGRGLSERLEELTPGGVGGAPFAAGVGERAALPREQVHGGPHGGAPQGGARSPHSGGEQARGQVKIKNTPPRFLKDPALGELGVGEGRVAGGEALTDGREFVPSAPQAVQQPVRRVPQIDQKGAAGQSEIEAYEPERRQDSAVEAKKVGFFGRLTGRGRRKAEVRPERRAEGAAFARPEGDGQTESGAFLQGQRPPLPSPVPVRQEAPLHEPPVEERSSEIRDEPPAQGGAGDQWGAERPAKPAGERYPAYKIQKTPPIEPLEASDCEDEQVPADIPPFLRQGQSKG